MVVFRNLKVYLLKTFLAKMIHSTFYDKTQSRELTYLFKVLYENFPLTVI